MTDIWGEKPNRDDPLYTVTLRDNDTVFKIDWYLRDMDAWLEKLRGHYHGVVTREQLSNIVTNTNLYKMKETDPIKTLKYASVGAFALYAYNNPAGEGGFDWASIDDTDIRELQAKADILDRIEEMGVVTVYDDRHWSTDYNTLKDKLESIKTYLQTPARSSDSSLTICIGVLSILKDEALKSTGGTEA